MSPQVLEKLAGSEVLAVHCNVQNSRYNEDERKLSIKIFHWNCNYCKFVSDTILLSLETPTIFEVIETAVGKPRVQRNQRHPSPRFGDQLEEQTRRLEFIANRRTHLSGIYFIGQLNRVEMNRRKMRLVFAGVNICPAFSDLQRRYGTLRIHRSGSRSHQRGTTLAWLPRDCDLRSPRISFWPTIDPNFFLVYSSRSAWFTFHWKRRRSPNLRCLSQYDSLLFFAFDATRI